MAFLIAGIAVSLIYVTAVVLQRCLLFPAPKNRPVLKLPTHHISYVQIPVGDHYLDGYLATPLRDTKKRNAIIYFNGRREHPTSVFNLASQLPDHEILCFTYRNLGFAINKPSEEQLVSDGTAVLDWLATNRQVPSANITVIGRSLGAGIAIQVAARSCIEKLVLISPFDRLINAIRHFRIPIPLVALKDRFDSVANIVGVSCPCLLVVGITDRTIPVSLSRALLSDWDGHLKEIAVAGVGHCGILRRDEVQFGIAQFLGVQK